MKKVLIISYYWPPSGGIGVLRCLKIAKYLREFGWEPVVFTAENADYPGHDETNFKDIPEGITILKCPIFEPYKYYRQLMGKSSDENVNNALVANDDKESLMHKFSVWVRSNFFIPDARAFWIKPAVKFLSSYLEENKVDAIFSDGPPHSNTMIACHLKDKFNIPWLADFQDPWTQVDYYQKLILTDWADKKHHRLEQWALKSADRISIVSDTWKGDLESIGAQNVSVIVWGYDEDDYKNLQANLDKKFTITHTGLIGEDRNPAELLEVVAELIDENKDFAEDIEIQLIGQVDISIRKNIEQYNLQSCVKVIEQVNRAEALQFCADSQMLLLLLNQAANAAGRIPGKLFEYLAVRRPILCLGNPKGDSANIIRNAQAGEAFDYQDKQALKVYLHESYNQFRSEKQLPFTQGDINQFTSREITRKVSVLLDEII